MNYIVNVIIIYSDVWNPGPVNNIIYVNVIIIYSDVRNPDPAYNIIYVSVTIIRLHKLYCKQDLDFYRHYR
jgi:hypothetical protein